MQVDAGSFTRLAILLPAYDYSPECSMSTGSFPVGAKTLGEAAGGTLSNNTESFAAERIRRSFGTAAGPRFWLTGFGLHNQQTGSVDRKRAL